MTEACERVQENVQAMHGEMSGLSELEEVVRGLEEMTKEVNNG